MIYSDRKIGIECMFGTGEDLLCELGCISSSIEEKLSQEVGIENAEKLVDEAILVGRRYNREYVYGCCNVSTGRVEDV